MPKNQSPKVVGDLSDLPSILTPTNVAPKVAPTLINSGRGKNLIHEEEKTISQIEKAVESDTNIVKGLVLENTRTKNGKFVTGTKILIKHPNTDEEIVIPYFMSTEQKSSDLPKIFSIVTVRLVVDSATRDRVRYKIDEILNEERTEVSDSLLAAVKPLIDMPEHKTLYLSDLASALNRYNTKEDAFESLGITSITGIIAHPLLFIGRCK